MAEVKKGLYKHFKGARVLVKNIAKHSETQEDFVVYDHIDASAETKAGTIWVRPLAMFVETVSRPDYSGPRFEYLSPGENLTDRKTQRVGAGFGVLITKGNKVLLGHRNVDPKKADSVMHGEGTWCLPGGKIKMGESLTEAGKRELLEETGIRAKKIKVIGVQNDIAAADAHYITVALMAVNWRGEPKIMEPNEMTEWRWFDIKKLPKPMFKPAAKIIKNYLGKTFCSDK